MTDEKTIYKVAEVIDPAAFSGRHQLRRATALKKALQVVLIIKNG